MFKLGVFTGAFWSSSNDHIKYLLIGKARC